MANGIKEKIEDANKEAIDKVLASNPVLVAVSYTHLRAHET